MELNINSSTKYKISNFCKLSTSLGCVYGLVLFSLGFNSPVLAIVDNEASAHTGLKEGWSRSAKVSHESSSGNSETFSLGTTFSIERHHLLSNAQPTLPASTRYSDTNQFISRFRILGSYDFQESNDTTVKNVSYLHTRWTRMWNPTLGYELFMQNEFNEFKRIENRLLLGLGFRVDMLRTQETGLWFGSAYMYESKELDTEGLSNISATERADRWSNYATFVKRFSEEKIVLQNTLYYQPNFSDMQDYDLYNNLQLSFSINGSARVGVQHRYQYDSLPPGDVEKADSHIKSFFALSF